jgi:hypothetical protein
MGSMDRDGLFRFASVIVGILCGVLAPARAGTWEYGERDPAALARRMDQLLVDPSTATPSYWQSKPTLRATLTFSLKPTLTDEDREKIVRFKNGEFKPHRPFPWKPIGVPPPWRQNPYHSRSARFRTHALRWAEPLVVAGVIEKDAECLDLARRSIEGWIRANSRTGNAPEFAWYDHAVSNRTRFLCWFWEMWRKSPDFDPELARLILSSVYQHIMYLADNRNYSPRSNHGLHIDGSLLAATLTFPEFRVAAACQQHAYKRFERYLTTNFSQTGFNLEQSPWYHFWVIEDAGEIAMFLRENREKTPQAIEQTIERAIAVCPYLIRPDGRLPNVGDTGPRPPARWRERALTLLGRDALPVAPPSLADPRGEGSSYMLCPGSGYAILTSYRIGERAPATDTYLLFRCNASRHTSHCHPDALSFELFAYGCDWLVDSGMLHYEKTPERAYMLSPRAHNVVLVDNGGFGFSPVHLVTHGRSEAGDFVEARQTSPRATHTRRIEFTPPRSIRLVDVLVAKGNTPRTFAQLFHVAPGLALETVSDDEVRLRAENGKVCFIRQLGDDGQWSVVTGQKEPYLQGWYSRTGGKIEPSPTLYFTTLGPVRRCRFETRIMLGSGPAAPQSSGVPRPKDAPTPTTRPN